MSSKTVLNRKRTVARRSFSLTGLKAIGKGCLSVYNYNRVSVSRQSPIVYPAFQVQGEDDVYLCLEFCPLFYGTRKQLQRWGQRIGVCIQFVGGVKL